MKPTFYIHTLGCQMNKSDSEFYSAVLQQAGYQPADELSADICIVNTCAVREASVHKMESLTGKWVAMRRNTSKPSKIGVIGCVPAVDIKDFKKKHKTIDFVIGTYPDSELMRKALIETLELESIKPANQESKISEFVPITSGCNCFCTYCIVPYTRGRLISRDEDEIITEIETKLSNGTAEITLLGQNVNEFGLDKGERYGFVRLLEHIDELDGLKRLRFITSHPKDMDDHTIERMSKLKRLAPYFHLPVQSGSNEILRRMARGYTREQYLHLISKIREYFPISAITTDTIVGFPGETTVQFEETLSLMEEVRFDQVFSAMYSPRPKTPAGKMENRCDSAELHRRINLLLDKQREIGRQITEKYLGEQSEVLTLEHKGDMTVGMNERGRFVDVKGTHPIGEIVTVRITFVDKRLKGELI